jgi:hypothetical protein
MTKHLLLSALFAWMVLMGIVWALFVPHGLSIVTFTLCSLTGPLALVAAARASATGRPAPSTP